MAVAATARGAVESAAWSAAAPRPATPAAARLPATPVVFYGAASQPEHGAWGGAAAGTDAVILYSGSPAPTTPSPFKSYDALLEDQEAFPPLFTEPEWEECETYSPAGAAAVLDLTPAPSVAPLPLPAGSNTKGRAAIKGKSPLESTRKGKIEVNRKGKGNKLKAQRINWDDPKVLAELYQLRTVEKLSYEKMSKRLKEKYGKSYNRSQICRACNKHGIVW